MIVPKSRLRTMRTKSLVVREIILIITMAIAWGTIAPVVYHFWGAYEVLVAALAAGVCLAGAALALAVSHFLRGPTPSHALASVLASMALRAGLPLVAVLAAIHLQDGLRNHPSIVYYVLFFYLVALMIETYLSLPSLPEPTPGSENLQ